MKIEHNTEEEEEAPSDDEYSGDEEDHDFPISAPGVVLPPFLKILKKRVPSVLPINKFFIRIASYVLMSKKQNLILAKGL